MKLPVLNRKRMVFSSTPRWLATVSSLALLQLGGCVDGFGGNSDVPCFETTAWRVGHVSFRLEDDGVLITFQTFEDIAIDNADGRMDYIPHQAIYRYDATSKAFELTDNIDWDAAATSVVECCLNLLEVGPFQVDGTILRFHGDEVSMAGASVLTLSAIPGTDRVAVLSTDGRVGVFGNANGQHYHQVFSVQTGLQLGRTLRLGVGGLEHDTVGVKWTPGGRFVLYHQFLNHLSISGNRICIVDTHKE